MRGAGMTDGAKEVPDFFLGSYEHRGEWARVRACRRRGLLVGPDDREYLWIEVDPPVSGQLFGLGSADVIDLIVSPRYVGTSLSPPSEWPLAVQVYRVLNRAALRRLRFGAEDVSLDAWGSMFETRNEAEERPERPDPG